MRVYGLKFRAGRGKGKNATPTKGKTTNISVLQVCMDFSTLSKFPIVRGHHEVPYDLTQF